MANRLHILSNVHQGKVFKENLTETLDSLTVVFDSVGESDIGPYDLVKMKGPSSSETCTTCSGTGKIDVLEKGYYKCDFCDTTYTTPRFACTSLECSNYNVLIPGGLPYIPDRTKYDPCNVCGGDGRIEVDSFVNWLVGSISSEMVVKIGDKLWRNTLVLIEPTKILERYLSSPCSFTNKTDTLYQQIQKAINKAELKIVGQASIFDISALEQFNSIPGEDFIFSGTSTLREILDSMLGVVGHRVTATINDDFSKIVLGARNLDAQGPIKELTNVVNRSASQSMEYLASEYVTSLSNAQSRGVIVEEWMSPKPVGYMGSDDELRLVVKHPIEKLEKAQIRLKVNFYYQGETVQNMIVDVDFTGLFVEQETFITMPLTEQEKYIPYQRGSTEIGFLDTRGWLFFKFNKIDDYIKPIVIDIITNEYGRVPYSTSYLIRESLYQITYSPYINIEVSQSKNLDSSFKSQMIINQDAASPDLNRFSTRGGRLAKMLGNKERFIDVNVKNSSDLFSLGDRIEDNYALIDREYSVFDNFVKCRYTFAQHYSYANTSRVSRERRLYNIPLDGYVEHNIFVKHKLSLSTVSNTSTDDLAFAMTHTLFGGNTPLDTLFIDTGYSGLPFGIITLPLARFKAGNLLMFKASMHDNYSAGLSIGTFAIGGKIVHQNPYCSQDGEFSKVGLQLISSNLDTLTFEKQREIATQKPSISLNLGDYRKKAHTAWKEYNVSKDRLEKSTFTFDFNLELDPKIILGEYTFPLNKLFVWHSGSEKYSATDTKKCKGVRTNHRPSIVANGNGIAIDSFAAQYPANQVAAWGIGDIDGNLVAAVNNNFTNVWGVYFKTLS